MRKYLLFCFILISFSQILGQSTYLMNVTNTVNITCPATHTLYDSGGNAGNYANSENYTRTFTAPVGYCVRVSVNYTTESCCDRLRIYDGGSTASPLVWTLAGTGGPANLTGSGQSITLNWTSDGSIVYAGFAATITCVSACSGVPVAGVISVTASNSLTCPGAGTVSMSSTSSNGCGITHQWQSATSPSGPWTNIASPAGISYNISGTPFTGLTYFRKQTCCGASCVFSNTISVGSGSGSTCGLSNYVASTTTYNWETFVGTTAPSTDDVLYNNLPLFGFNFCFTGANYWGGYIASNGALVFAAVPCFPNILSTTYAAPGIGTGYTIPSAAPVNNTSIPRNAILGPWHDIDPSVGGTIRYITLGTAPNRRFIISYENVPMFSGACNTNASLHFSGQIKIFETTNIIEIHIRNKQVCASWNSGYAVMGLHSFDGTTYIPPVNMTAHNVPTQWTMTNTAYRFSAPCATNTGPCAVLPIHFKNFYGERVDGINKLTWETALEENVKEFLVEQSNDAEKFIPIAKVSAKNDAAEYKYDDKNTKSGTINYYRITSVEYNGERKSTFVIPLGDMEADVAVSGVFPNPVKGDFSVSLNSRIMETVEVKVYDMFGKVVKQFTKALGVGLQQLDFNLSDVASGTYMLEISSPNRGILSQQKLIKVD